MNRLLKNTAVVGAFTACSRVLGLVREMLQSRAIGAGMEQSAFTLAFALPNMARKLFGEGALTAAFVPVFKGVLENESREKARRLARAVLTMMLVMLVSAVGLILLGLGMAERLVAVTDRQILTLKLVMILMPYMIFICGAAFGMGVLNAMGRFRASSSVPCLLNLIWIAVLAVMCFLPDVSLGVRVKAVAWAILFAGLAQMVMMFACMRRAGISPGLLFSGWRDGSVRMVWRNTAVAAMGAGAVQVNYMLDQVLGQIAAPWAAGVIGYAERLMDLPLGVIGVAFGTVLLPTFAGHFAKGDSGGAKDAFVSSSLHMLFVMIPAAVGLGLLAPEVTSAIYQGGAFDAQAVSRVSRALSVYAVGLGFFGLQKSLVPWFQAQNDMRTPLRVSVKTVVLNAVLNVLSVWLLPVEWRHVGLAGSTVLCAACGCLMLSVQAKRRNGAIGFAGMRMPVLKMLVASGLMAAVLLWLRSVISLNAVFSLCIMIPVGAGAYFAASALLGMNPKRMRG